VPITETGSWATGTGSRGTGSGYG